MTVCFITQTKYSSTEPALARRLEILSAVCKPIVVGRSTTLRSTTVRSGVGYGVLLPNLGFFIGLPFFWAFGLVVSIWLIWSRECSVIVAQSPLEGFVAVIAARFVALFMKRPRVVIESHGDFLNVAQLIHPGLGGWLVSRLTRSLGVWAIRRADALRAVSQHTARQLSEIAPTLRVVIFPALTELSLFRSERKREEDTNLVLFVGSIAWVKGPDVFIEALGRLPRNLKTRARMIGPLLDGQLAARLRERVNELGTSVDVEITGPKLPFEVAYEMNKATILVVPSRSEALPRVILEGMAAGIPIIATPVGGVPELLSHELSGLLVPPDDAMGLSSAISRLLTDSTLRHKLSTKAGEYVEGLLSGSYYVDGYRGLFEDLQREGVLV